MFDANLLQIFTNEVEIQLMAILYKLSAVGCFTKIIPDFHFFSVIPVSLVFMAILEAFCFSAS